MSLESVEKKKLRLERNKVSARIYRLKKTTISDLESNFLKEKSNELKHLEKTIDQLEHDIKKLANDLNSTIQYCNQEEEPLQFDDRSFPQLSIPTLFNDYFHDNSTSVNNNDYQINFSEASQTEQIVDDFSTPFFDDLIDFECNTSDNCNNNDNYKHDDLMNVQYVQSEAELSFFENFPNNIDFSVNVSFELKNIQVSN